MSELSETGFQVPEYVRQYLRDMGYVLPLDPMDEHIRVWDDWMAARRKTQAWQLAWRTTLDRQRVTVWQTTVAGRRR